MGDARCLDPEEIRRGQTQSGQAYHEFVREPAMSVGLYVLRASAADLQSPHTEDEVYVVQRGRARIRLGEADRPVVPGSVIYVPAGLEHRFHDIVEDLEALVLFAPAEGTQSRGSGARP
ncbi:MAG TPA: cupin domain-containing protein [Thermoplasmata archaeon]|nr:cupin domain-containing protein [Thermoplasmata archaeon]